MKIAIIPNRKVSHSKEVLDKIKLSFDKSGIEYDVLDMDNLQNGYNLACAIGGDGTILKTSRFYAKTSTPVMGINLGRLGFLSLIPPSDASKLGEIIKNKEYTLRERMMLKSLGCSALNDIVIKGHSGARTSKFDLFVNDRLVSDYIADGIIVATPTGSTAYGLSAGGPIIHPGVDAMVIVPICAHTMTARPLVIPADATVMVKSSDEKLDMTCDGQTSIKELTEVIIEHDINKAILAFPKNYKFYSVLRNKLHWGISPVSEG